MKIVSLFIKRLFDIISSGILIILLTPVWVIIAILIKKDSEGPILFKQGRRTKDGKIFQMYKFRSMVVNAEKMGTGLFNYENDPRVTKIGRKLRDSSLDELPQLFNIFKGDMTVVGPRPCVTYELGDFDTLNKKYKKRFQVKAGLTGLAQIKGRNDISWDEKVTYDNEYVDMFNKFGFLADIIIGIESVFKAFKHNNIYENKIDDSMNDEESARAENAIVLVISIFLYGFIGVITLIGITNIFNTITTNMNLRKKEFAMLKSIGMTKKEFNRMIRLESIFYGLKSLIVGIPIGTILSYGMYTVFRNNMEMEYVLPYKSIVMSIVFVAVIIGIIMKYSMSKINKQNVIETIRNDNI